MPRAGLSRQVVIAEAARLADEVGYEALTLTALAERFGVAVPSLYKHVRGLEDLREGVAALALRELGEAMVASQASTEASRPGGRGPGRGGPGRGGPGRTRLRAICDAYRAFAGEHPGRYAATLRAATADEPERAAAAGPVLAIVLEVLVAMGLHDDDAVHAARALRATLHGFVSLERAGGFGLPQHVDGSFARAVAWLEQGLASSASRPPGVW